jgi:hypothetical protein
LPGVTGLSLLIAIQWAEVAQFYISAIHTVPTMASEQETSTLEAQTFSTPLFRTTDVVNTYSTLATVTTASGPPLTSPDVFKQNFITIGQMMNDY